MQSEDVRRAAAAESVAALRDSGQQRDELDRSVFPRGTHPADGLVAHAPRIRKEGEAEEPGGAVGGGGSDRVLDDA